MTNLILITATLILINIVVLHYLKKSKIDLSSIINSTVNKIDDKFKISFKETDQKQVMS